MSARTTILLADDHPLFRLGMKFVVESNPDLEIVGEASEGQEALAMIERLKPNVAVVDLKMPKLTGLDILRRVTKRRFKTRIVILTMYDEAEIFNEALMAGVHGYLLKDNAVSDILECLETVAKGEVYLSPARCPMLPQNDRGEKRPRPNKVPLETLTSTERIVLLHIAGNKTTKQIAAELEVSFYTIEAHRRNIGQKLKLSGSHSILRFAIEHRSEIKNRFSMIKGLSRR